MVIPSISTKKDAIKAIGYHESREGNDESIRNEKTGWVSMLVNESHGGVVLIKNKARRRVQMTRGQSELLSKSCSRSAAVVWMRTKGWHPKSMRA